MSKSSENATTAGWVCLQRAQALTSILLPTSQSEGSTSPHRSTVQYLLSRWSKHRCFAAFATICSSSDMLFLGRTLQSLQCCFVLTGLLCIQCNFCKDWVILCPVAQHLLLMHSRSSAVKSHVSGHKLITAGVRKESFFPNYSNTQLVQGIMESDR